MESTKENYKTNVSTEELIALSNEFDNYDIVEHLAESEPAELEVQLNRRQFRLEKSLAERISRISQKKTTSTIRPSKTPPVRSNSGTGIRVVYSDPRPTADEKN